MPPQKFHPKVSEKLDEWQKIHYSEYYYWEDEGNEPTQDQKVELFLLTEVYNNDVRKQMDTWTRAQYVAWRDKVIRKAFPTIYYPELLHTLAELNVKFGVK